MLAKTESVALIGADAHLVEVEVDVGTGLPAFTVVGLPAKSVQEAAHRTRSALVASEERWPPHRIVANLAPGGLRKEGTHFDLAIAMGVLAADRRLDAGALNGWVFMGELALGGQVRPTAGVLPAAIACREAGRIGIVCAAGNAGEAAIVQGVQVVPVTTVGECIAFLRGKWEPPRVEPRRQPAGHLPEDMAEVRGHRDAKRALEVAAAGGHNLLLIGPPGSGKTMLARRLPGILPRMSVDESLEVTKIHSVAGLLGPDASLITLRPFRTPHHHVSLAGLIGGGSGIARPGEISLAHHGALFLDELGMYRRDILDSLRGPVEDGTVRIARSGGVVTYPCRFSLVAAMNPCPCGFRNDRSRACTCAEHDFHRYRSRLSGPLLDRIDLQAEMKRLTRNELMGPPQEESSESIRARVERARERQTARYGSSLVTNASAPRAVFDRGIEVAPTARSLLGEAVDAGRLTGRGLARAIRVARTLADLDDRDEVTAVDVGDALGLRLLEHHDEVAA